MSAIKSNLAIYSRRISVSLITVKRMEGDFQKPDKRQLTPLDLILKILIKGHNETDPKGFLSG
jgi:hypothetical protein